MIQTMRDIFTRLRSHTHAHTSFRFKMSYLEIYNESIRDLLSNSNTNKTINNNNNHSRNNKKRTMGLSLREDPTRGMIVAGLSYHYPKNAEEVCAFE